jgi:O-Antigen ligase
VRILRPTAAALGALFVVAFQLQLVPFFSHLFVDDRLFWPVVFYGIWALAIGITMVLLIMQSSVRRQSLPMLAVCASAMLLTLIHPMDSVAKNFLVAVTFVACVGVLAIASAPFALLRFSASVTVLSAVICLLDILFSHGFSTTSGRAAGLSINANVAAAGLLLGAASSFWTVPQRWRGPFLLIIGTAIFATLSRSTLLAAVVICSGVAADSLRTRIRSRAPRARVRWIGSAALALALTGWIALALFSNDRFPVAVTRNFLQIGSAPTAFAEAHEAISNSLRAKTATQVEANGLSIPRAGVDLDSKAKWKLERKLKSEEIIKEVASRGGDLAEAREAIASWLRANTAPQVEATSRPEPAAPSTAAPGPNTLPSRHDLEREPKSNVERKFKSEEVIEEIARRAENEGDINSISARGLLIERAYLSYQNGPVFGQGFAAAHALQPHNTFLLFALAFGDLGWIVPLALLGLTAYSIRSVQQLPLFLASFAVMMTSHDILFTLGLLAPFILGIAGLNAQRYHVDDAPDAVAAIRYAAAAAPVAFVICGISTLGIGPSRIAGAPKLLLFLVFCAIALWSVGIWRWHKELFQCEKDVS